MESDEDREIQNEEDERGYDSKKRKLSSSLNEDQQKEKYTVGMIAVSQANGLFSDPHEVGNIIAGTDGVGEIRSVRITRSGMVIIDCKTKQQMKQVLRIDEWDDKSVKCFRLGAKARKKGVISGVPHSVMDLAFKDIEGVCEARRMMKRSRDGEWQESMSICLTFEGELPARVYQDYVCYRVRPFEAAPLRCFSCQEYGHVAVVCRAQRRCGNCGKAECVKRRCEKELTTPKCIHCEGEHHAGSLKCPRRIKEGKVDQIRRQGRMSYADAVKKLEEKESLTQQEEVEPEERRNEANQNNMCWDKKGFLAFIAMVLNCAMEIPRKSERIKMVLDAAKRFLNVGEISGEELDDMLRGGCAPPQL